MAWQDGYQWRGRHLAEIVDSNLNYENKEKVLEVIAQAKKMLD
jgi:hypothetical protein